MLLLVKNLNGFKKMDERKRYIDEWTRKRERANERMRKYRERKRQIESQPKDPLAQTGPMSEELKIIIEQQIKAEKAQRRKQLSRERSRRYRERKRANSMNPDYSDHESEIPKLSHVIPPSKDQSSTFLNAQIAGTSTNLKDYNSRQTNGSSPAYSLWTGDNNAYTQFLKQFVQNGNGHACEICNRLWFKSGSRNFEVVIKNHESMEFVRTFLSSIDENLIEVCSMCHSKIQLKEDLENYVKFSLVGGTPKIKADVLPHKFECQPQGKFLPKNPPRIALINRRTKADIEEIIKTIELNKYNDSDTTENIITDSNFRLSSDYKINNVEKVQKTSNKIIEEIVYIKQETPENLNISTVTHQPEPPPLTIFYGTQILPPELLVPNAASEDTNETSESTETTTEPLPKEWADWQQLPNNWGVTELANGSLMFVYVDEVLRQPTRSLLVRRDRTVEIRAMSRVSKLPPIKEVNSLEDIHALLLQIAHLRLCLGPDNAGCNYSVLFSPVTKSSSPRCKDCQMQRQLKIRREWKKSKRQVDRKKDANYIIKNLKRKYKEYLKMKPPRVIVQVRPETSQENQQDSAVLDSEPPTNNLIESEPSPLVVKEELDLDLDVYPPLKVEVKEEINSDLIYQDFVMDHEAYTIQNLIEDWKINYPNNVPEDWVMTVKEDGVLFVYFGDVQDQSSKSHSSLYVKNDMNIEAKAHGRTAGFPTWSNVTNFEDLIMAMDQISYLKVCEEAECTDGFFIEIDKTISNLCTSCYKTKYRKRNSAPVFIKYIESNLSENEESLNEGA